MNGRIIFIENKKELRKHITSLYQNNMGENCLGTNIIKHLKQINTREEFEDFIYNFNKENFPNKEVEINMYFIDGEKLETTDEYKYKHISWVSNYLYIKNASTKTIKILCEDKTKYLKPNETITIKTRKSI